MRQKSASRATRILAAARARLPVLITVLALSVAGAARGNAEEGSEYRGTQAQQMACAGDVFRLCWNDIPNVSRIVGCLQREKPRLSSACRAVFEQNIRTASNRWQRRHQRVATGSAGQLQPSQGERRAEVAPAEPIRVAATERPPVTASTSFLAAPHTKHLRSKAALRSKHRLGRIHRHNPTGRHRLALAATKQYRR